MANDQATAANASQRDVSNEKPGPFQDCSDVIHISVFFDGTGNNKDADEGPQKWSNPARLWRASRLFADQKGSTAYPIYVAGVGTAFNGQAISATDKIAITVEDGKAGLVSGAGGTRRLGFGQQQVNDAVRKTLLLRAKSLGGKVASYAQAGQSQSFGEVNKTLGKHRLIKMINVSIFGFSRGAALARAYCNQWLWDCKEDHGNLTYEGYPIRFVFMGLFDTVASFGIPSTNAANSLMYGGFKGRDLVVDERVERCVHFVAAHELRFSFPVDLIRTGGKLNGRWLEKTYPGVHSDVGGGYEPKEQGQNNNYARIPMMDMMREAETHGVRILGYNELKNTRSYKAIFQERFECKPETLQAYGSYKAACNPGGTIENQVQHHMAALYNAYGTLHRKGIQTVTQRQHTQGQSWSRLGPDDMGKELENYQNALKKAQQHLTPSFKNSLLGPVGTAFAVKEGLYAMWISPQQWQIDAWSKTAADGLMEFVHSYVHDSKVGFISNAEPFSYFSKRGVSESERSVQGWFEEHVSRPIGHAYDATEDKANEIIDEGKKVAQAAEKKVESAYEDGKKAVANTYEQTKAAVSKAKDEAGHAIQSGARQAGEAVNSAMDAANKAWQSLGW